MTEGSSLRLAEGRAALARHDWPAVYRLLSELDPTELSPSELEGLAEAANCHDDLDAGVAAAERAYAGFVAADDTARAAWNALMLATWSFVRGDLVVAGGWWATADRLLAGAPECPAHALALQSHAYLHLDAGEVDAAVDAAQRAVDIARRTGHRDAEMVALQFEGQARPRRGEVREGMALMDEAMVSVVSGQVGPWAVGHIVCQTLTACQHVGDYRRAAEWLESSDRLAGASGMQAFSADCRIHRAGILKLRGSWARAESEARIGCSGHPFGWHVGWGWCEIGEIHLQMGDLVGAEEAFAVAHEKGYPPHPGLALLRLAQGDVELASNDIEQAFTAARASEDLPARARLLEARVRIALAAEDAATARASADELSRIASTCCSEAFEALAACADGRVRLAEGDISGAAAALRQGVDALVAIEMPYEAAMSRCGLAGALKALGNTDGALMELRAARSTFVRLGAALDERHVVTLLEESDETTTASSMVGKTFMFTDIERSTLLLEAIGDAAWDAMLQWHDRTLREAIHASEGREVKHEGDGFFAAFDEPAAAIDCGVSIQQRLSRHRKEHGFAPQVRIGLSTGSAIERDGDYFGLAVNTAARVMSLAAGGEIMATAELMHASPQSASPREVRLKGVSEPVTVVTVEWEHQV